ncbi:hypothetical protein CDL15_Pgr000573 [Punica granatum]|uniref:Uncharacterized protein n=1 Tax=Punica granatum TaxID=22663 RepID=A0A218W4G0_PUNGR|nr:hypothetical protein CDL15_Pgr000573 [Punica granatum]PKI51472.1 hypothetical protein CRG98_028183 [Punica granatum]
MALTDHEEQFNGKQMEGPRLDRGEDEEDEIEEEEREGNFNHEQMDDVLRNDDAAKLHSQSQIVTMKELAMFVC